MAKRYHLVPGITQRQAAAWIRAHHDHNDPPRGDIYRIAAADTSDRIVGIAIVGRPIARALDDGWTVEILRVAIRRDLDPERPGFGPPGACSFLYAAAWRAARELGYRRAITYTLDRESGSSIRALAGWRPLPIVEGRSWTTVNRPRSDKKASLTDKRRWEAVAGWRSDLSRLDLNDQRPGAAGQLSLLDLP